MIFIKILIKELILKLTVMDSDGDGLYDNSARMVYDGITVATPKDPEPLVYNGKPGVWDNHVNQLQIANNAPKDYIDEKVDISGIILGDNIPDKVSEFLVENLLKIRDDVFRIGSYMDFDRADFSADNKNYALWFWKGDYWNLQSGGEIGLYENPTNLSGTDHYDAVDFEVPMTLSLYNYYSRNNIGHLFSWLPTTEQWWITGFNANLKNPDPSVMVSVGSVDLSSKTSIYEGLKSTKQKVLNNLTNRSYRLFKNNILLDDDTKTVWLIW